MQRPMLSLLVRRWEKYGLKLIRFGGVAVISSIVGFTTFTICLYAFDWNPLLANFTSVAVSTPPAYVLNRRWVWGRKDSNHSASKEVGPFWVLTFTGFLFSSTIIGIVDGLTDSRVLILFAQVGAFGMLWLLKFVLLEKYLWPSEDSSARAIPNRVL